MRAPRSSAALAGIALLGTVLTACADNASGQLMAHNGDRVVETLSNPPTGTCHRFPQGVTHVDNHMLSNIVLYTTEDCTVPEGGGSTYLAQQSSDEAVHSTGLWRSFGFAHE
ncbi:hypothetical protein OG739_19840 [Streptomyces longwoodensis]|uniref:hypothetical protein n=1 Tax=Streptomyces longwoodensis TaxID=68231 RepID=UPI002257A078|nr:hypothetical protein [Streptomyces longwoodensis]MCX4994963.1 hypothetical protein [Streptomyces longwoodensis]WRY89772.1 hypothetical protein OG481_15235 [Streptomyces longwoodensis]WTI45934.1 hypothetical protein OG547_16145 [Streptomyces longwoodensis]WUC58743.1 hypothetical protein OHA09_17355 [Streptomyces longwoodensis]